MNKTTLIVVLAIQLVIIGVLLAARGGNVTEPEPLLSFDAAAVDALTVSNAEGSVKLVKSGAAWQLPGGAPADATKIDAMLEKLADSPGSWPVATTAKAVKRFEVGVQNHQRRLTLSANGEVVADIYLGTSPSYRRAHARRVGDDDVYAITFSNYEATVEASDWLDKALLRPRGTIASVTRPAVFELTRDDAGGWTSADGAILDQGKAQALAGHFKGLTALGVRDAAPSATPAMTFMLTDDEGTMTLAIHHLEEDTYAATSDRTPGFYQVSSYLVKQLDVGLAELAPDAADGDEQAGES